MENEILSVHDLNVFLGSEHVVQDVSFSVERGEVLVVLGPNGSGKTTLLRALLGAVSYAGTVTWQTQKINYLPPKELVHRKDLPPLSMREFFSFKHVSQERIKTVLDRVGIEHRLLDRQFGALSTGQFQRMLIAWGLVDDPDVLLLDEPTLGIDIGGQETLYALLHEIWKERNLTMLIVTHDMNFVWEHAQNVLCLNKRMHCYGAPEKALTAENIKQLYGAGVRLYEHRHGNE